MNPQHPGVTRVEIDQLRREERFKDLANRVVDHVAYDLQAAPELGHAVYDAAVDKAAGRYADQLPRQLIATLVAAQLRLEAQARESAARLRHKKPHPRRGLLSRRAM